MGECNWKKEFNGRLLDKHDFDKVLEEKYNREIMQSAEAKPLYISTTFLVSKIFLLFTKF